MKRVFGKTAGVARGAIAAVLALVFVVEVGCGGGGGGGGSTTPTSQTVVLPAAGGVVQNASGTVSVTLGANAVAKDTSVTLTTPSGLPDASQAVSGTAVAFSSVTLNSSVALTFVIPASVTQTDLAVYTLSGTTWTALTSSADLAHHTVSALAPTLGTFAVFSASVFASAATPTVTAEATIYPATGGVPAVRVSWTPSGFTDGNNTRAAWQVYRSDVPSTPVQVAVPSSTSVLDTESSQSLIYTNFGTNDLGACSNTSANNASTTTTGIVPGKPYTYAAQLIYSLPSADIPGSSSGMTCFFASPQVSSSLATPLSAPSITTPQNSTIGDGSSISWQSPESASTALTIQYQIEASTSPTFSSPVSLATLQSTSAGSLSATLSGISAAFPSDTVIYVRIGARNLADVPGPVPDSLTQERYIFGSYASMRSK